MSRTEDSAGAQAANGTEAKAGIGAKITELREALLLSPEDLAERCGCDLAVINDLEAGALAP
ncbi:MAG: helix-turn-helix domain-containing protein, partial [Coriobacteriia bacterium]|nr:helix-turn-helix domain-containing protein [Coriobacteriia bacterium]